MLAPSRKRSRTIGAILIAAVGFAVIGGVMWMSFLNVGERDPSALETVSRDGATREFLTAREHERAADAHREREGDSVVVREERADAELPANAVRIRVIDAEGRGVANIPVGLIDLQAVPLPFFDLVRSWQTNHGPAKDELPARGQSWAVRHGQAWKFVEGSSHIDVTSSSFILDPIVVEQQVWARSSIEGLGFLKPKSVFFVDAFVWRGVTDAEGEAIAIWDRERFPVVEASFAFPWRANHLQVLRAEDLSSPRDVTLVLPEIHRTRVVGVHDLAACAEATWHAHLIARGAGKDGAPIWISWDPFLPLSDAQDQAREWIWERGLDVEIEAGLDAPFATVITNDQIIEAEGSDAVMKLRSSDYYAGARGELRQWDGGVAPHAKVLWHQTEWTESGVAHSTYAQTSLGEEGQFELVQAASPRAMRARELIARLEGKSTRNMIATRRFGRINRQSDAYTIRDLLQQRGETYFDTSAFDSPGRIRDWGIQSFGAGPQLLAGVVRWTDGEAIQNAIVVLPSDWSATGSQELEAIRTNEQGMFRRLGIPRRQQCELEVITGIASPPSRFTVELGRTDLILEVPRRGGLAGKIVFERPTTIEVHAQDCEGEVRVGMLTNSGVFVVQGISVGPVKLSFRAHGVVLHEIESIVLSSSKVERPDALANVDLRALAYLMTLVLHDEEGQALKNATTTVSDPMSGFQFAGRTNALAELTIAVPYSVNRVVLASPRYRDLELIPSAGRMVLRLSTAR